MRLRACASQPHDEWTTACSTIKVPSGFARNLHTHTWHKGPSNFGFIMCFSWHMATWSYTNSSICSNYTANIMLSIPGTRLLARYSRTGLKRPLKNRQNKNLNVTWNSSLMKVESIAECSIPFGAFCNPFGLHYLKTNGLFESGRLRQVFCST